MHLILHTCWFDFKPEEFPYCGSTPEEKCVEVYYAQAAGVDTAVVLVVNDNLASDHLGTVAKLVENVRLDVQLPGWLKSASAFEITCEGAKDVATRTADGSIMFDLCTIDLTERTISSYRYGLAYLNEQLELYKEATHHRALSDAITTAKLFKRTLNYIPHSIITAEDLLNFSKEAKRLKRPKFDPGQEKKEEEEDR